jgi:hypothetical protein
MSAQMQRVTKQAAGEKVDVLIGFVRLLSFGGMFEPKQIVRKWNYPRGTGHIASACVPLGAKKLPTGKVLRALESAAQSGLVMCVGGGHEHNRAWNKNAAHCKERYWILTDAGLAAADAALTGASA